MSELTKHGIHSNVQIPPDSTGKRVHHTMYFNLAVSGLVVPTVSLPWDVSTASGLEGFIVGYGPIQGSSNNRLDVILREDSNSIEFTIGDLITITGTGVSLSCTVVSIEKVYNPSVSVSGGNNPNNILSIDKVGAAYVRFTEGEQQLDPKGLTRFSTPSTVLDIQFFESTNSTFAYGKATGAATETFLAPERLLAMDCQTTVGDGMVKRSNKYAIFQNGFSSIVETAVVVGDTGKTGVVRRWGYYDDSNGLYFELDENTLYVVVRSNTSGTVVNTRVAQNQWNGDTLNGDSGASNLSFINLDVSKMNLYFIDLPGSAAGRVRFGIYGPNGRIVAHEFYFGNNSTTNFMRTAVLPLTWEQFNSGASASPSRMKVRGGVVLNEGFQTPESQVAGGVSSTYFTPTAKTFTGSTFGVLASTRSGILAPDGLTTNRKTTIPQKLMYHIEGGPVIIQIRAGMVLLDAAYMRPSTGSPGEIDITAVWPTIPQYQGVPQLTRIYSPGTYIIDPPAGFNMRGQGLTLRSDGAYGLAYTFVAKPINPADTVSIYIGIDWTDI